MIYLINSPRLTSFGHFSYEEITREEVRNYLIGEYTSLIGHTSTGELINWILQLKEPVAVSREELKQKPGDIAIVFELILRDKTFRELSFDELKQLPSRWGLLKRLT